MVKKRDIEGGGGVKFSGVCVFICHLTFEGTLYLPRESLSINMQIYIYTNKCISNINYKK